MKNIKKSNNSLSLINSQVSAENISNVSADIKEYILSGEEDPLNILIRLKAISKVLDNIFEDSDLKESFLKSANLENQKSFIRNYAKIDIRNNGKYDYTICQDPFYNELIKEKEDIDLRLKARKSFLSLLKEDFHELDMETGEIKCTIYPPKKSGGDGVVVTIK